MDALPLDSRSGGGILPVWEPAYLLLDDRGDLDGRDDHPFVPRLPKQFFDTDTSKFPDGERHFRQWRLIFWHQVRCI